jgi:DNA-binding winged helix-turn-helix (wHTH) protein/TolB-like protein
VTYRFATFEFDAQEGALRRDGRAVPLEPKPARALSLLLERAGQLLTRDELRARLWDDGTHVDFERALAYCIGQVRQALGDSGDNPRFVQTVPRRGFRFIAPVTAAKADAQSPPPPGLSSTSSGIRRRVVPFMAAMAAVALAAIAWTAVQGGSTPALPIVAVALFDNETGDRSHDRALSRMTDAVVGQLTALGHERVGVVGNLPVLRQPRPARDLDAIARDTAASYVVLVQLQERAPDLSMLLQLIRLSDGVHVWVRRIPLAPSELDQVDEQTAARIEGAVRRFVLGEDVATP